MASSAYTPAHTAGDRSARSGAAGCSQPGSRDGGVAAARPWLLLAPPPSALLPAPVAPVVATDDRLRATSDEDSSQLAQSLVVCAALLALHLLQQVAALAPPLRFWSSHRPPWLGTVLLAMQSVATGILLLLAVNVRRQFGWRTFSRIAALRIPVQAYRALQLLRSSLEWALLLAVHALFKKSFYLQ